MINTNELAFLIYIKLCNHDERNALTMGSQRVINDVIDEYFIDEYLKKNKD